MLKKVADTNQVEIDRPFVAKVDGQEILLARTKIGLFALENSCPHQSRSLETGKIEGDVLTCIYHGVRIDLSTGELAYKAGYLGLEPAQVFAVDEQDGIIRVDVDDSNVKRK